MRFDVDGARAFAYTGARPFDPARPTVAFVHGGGLDQTVWVLQSRYVAHHGWNALALDLPGHGRSEGPPLETIEAMGGWVVRALDALEVRRAALVGHSMGSLVALDAAARDPGRTAVLVLVGTSAPMPVTQALLGAAEAHDHAAFDMVTVWGHGHRAQIGGNAAPGMWMTGTGLRLLERSRSGVLHTDLAACSAYERGADAARAVRCPVHLVLGRGDAMTPVRAGRALAQAFPDARVTELDGAGHMLMAERPDEVLEALLASLRAHLAPEPSEG